MFLQQKRRDAVEFKSLSTNLYGKKLKYKMKQRTFPDPIDKMNR